MHKIVFKEPYKDPVIMQIDDTLETEQKLIGGYIQQLDFEDNKVCLICDEDGKLKKLEPNINHKTFGTILGNIFIIGADPNKEEFCSLSDEQANRYVEELKEIAIKPIKIYESYKLMKKEQKEEFNKFPVAFAFSDEQFKKEMDKLGLNEKDTNKIIDIGYGGFIRKTDKQAYIDMCKRFSKEKQQSIINDKKGEKFIKEMFFTEMSNHEYGYTREIEPVLDALNLTIDKIMKFDNLKHGFEIAKEEYLKRCDEMEEEKDEESEEV